MRHSQARNINERIFGMAKKCFVIIWETNEYPMLTQANIVSTCGVVQNFIGTYDPDDQPEPWAPEAVFSSFAQASGSLGSGTIGGPEFHRASMKREDIAQAMWLSYQ